MEIDVALVPSETRTWPNTVCIVIDELRASSTLTTLLDLGCTELFVTRSLDEARRLGRERGALLAGERGGMTPRGFDANNSPVELQRADVRGRPAVLCTSNGTRVLGMVRRMPATLVGCLLNATACAEAAVRLAAALQTGIGIVCAGTLGRFALDDGVAAGVLVERITAALASRGEASVLTDRAIAAMRLRSAYSDLQAALAESEAGHLVTGLGQGDDVPFCARLDSTRTVPILRDGRPLRIERLGTSGA